MPTVTHVRKENSSDGTHKHIAKVKTTAAVTYTRAEVVVGLDKGEDWKTQAPSGASAKIEKISYCPASSCLLSPYIRTVRDATKADNLDNLPVF
jgi:Protein of unknown function (DUF3892)